MNVTLDNGCELQAGELFAAPTGDAVGARVEWSYAVICCMCWLPSWGHFAT